MYALAWLDDSFSLRFVQTLLHFLWQGVLVAVGVKVWNVETLTEERTLSHASWIRPLTLAPDGATLAVGRGDGSVRLWETPTWAEKASCEGHKSFTFRPQYSPDGKTLVGSGSDGTVRFREPEQAGVERAADGTRR